MQVADFLLSIPHLRLVRSRGVSMMPNIPDRALRVANRRKATKGFISRFEVVVLRDSVVGRRIIKRVVGLPGEEISVENNQLFVNGGLIAEPFETRGALGNGYFWALRKEEFIVLGDNREVSTDSRKLGPVHKDTIEGVLLNKWCG